MHAEQIQPDDHPGGERGVDGSDGGADEGAAGEVQVAEDFGRTSLWDHQALVWVHALSAQGPGESADGMEYDDPGLQLETGVEPGELRKTHGGGGGETPAKRLKGVAALFFPFAGSRIYPSRCPYGSNLWKTKTGDLKNRPPVKLFLRLPPAPRRSFYTASRFVRRHGHWPIFAISLSAIFFIACPAS
jgi:hypothetical protein